MELILKYMEIAYGQICTLMCNMGIYTNTHTHTHTVALLNSVLKGEEGRRNQTKPQCLQNKTHLKLKGGQSDVQTYNDALKYVCFTYTDNPITSLKFNSIRIWF